MTLGNGDDRVRSRADIKKDLEDQFKKIRAAAVGGPGNYSEMVQALRTNAARDQIPLNEIVTEDELARLVRTAIATAETDDVGD